MDAVWKVDLIDWVVFACVEVCSGVDRRIQFQNEEDARRPLIILFEVDA